MGKLFTALLTAALLSFPAFATVIYVPGDYPTIQAGIVAAVDGDTVLVGSGTYNESIDFLGKSISVISEEGPELTIIDPDSNTYVVRMWNEEDPGTLLEGFTITNSFGTGSTTLYLNGILCADTPTIRNNIICDNGNFWSAGGGGIRANNAQPVIENNRILNNRCVYEGGGIYILDCDTAIVSDNTISDNSVSSGYGFASGGGIHIENSNVIVDKNLITGNVADPDYCQGGGICITDSSIVDVINNTFLDNNGMGVYLYDGCTVSFINNILVGTDVGGGLNVGWGMVVLNADYNDVWDNSPANYVNCQPGGHDISLDPMFVDPGIGDFHLQEGSPCIDAGDPASPLDPDGTIADMGAFYYDQSVWVAPGSPSPQLTAYSLSPAYPNPFNPSTAISYQLQAASFVKLVVYDVMGREVAKLVDGYKPAGSYELTFDGSDLASGVYLARLNTNGNTLTQKLLLIK